MADTPEEVALHLCDRELTGNNDEDVPAIAKALREAEARGFAKGLEAAALWFMQLATDMLRALAPKAPPEVVAAEPKP